MSFSAIKHPAVSRRRRAAMLLALLLLTISVVQQGMANPIFVTTTKQGVTDLSNCSLQEAIYAANFDANIAIDATNFYTTGCQPGSGDDIIYLPDAATFQMDHLQDDQFNPFGPTATPLIFTSMTIEANGAKFVGKLANGRLFAVGPATITKPDGTVVKSAGNVNITIRNAYINGFHVHGGDGGIPGGGGGLGAGGAIFVDNSFGPGIMNVTVENCTFDGNSANGGNGALHVNSGPGGGGGGISGNGGGAEGEQTGLVEGGTGAGGGGGGSRGKGGANGAITTVCYPGGTCVTAWASVSGGGGGGTITDGQPGLIVGGGGGSIGAGGFACGGTGGGYRDDGHDAGCPGGGGGGGGLCDSVTYIRYGGDGGNGKYGGGGGGGCFRNSVDTLAIFGRQGGNGGFGGGGGGGGQGDNGGGSQFGGGGGGGGDTPGHGGRFGGNGSKTSGGAGGALGGAIFSHFANVTIKNSTFANNYVSHGFSFNNGAGNGGDAGGAIYAVDGSLTVLNSTVASNQATGSGAGIVADRTESNLVMSFTLRNTIVANNNGNEECKYLNGVTAVGSGNLIGNNGGCPGVVVSLDPLLGALQLNAPGLTPTMAIGDKSPAYNAADGSTSLSQDQRAVPRPQQSGFDIGAYEWIKPSADLAISKTTIGEPSAGQCFSWIIDVENQGPTDAQNVVITDTLPSGVTFSSITGSGGFQCTYSPGTVTCKKTVTQGEITTPVPMTAGEIDSLTLTVFIPASLAGTQLTNTATIGSSTLDPNANNNSASVTATVKKQAGLCITTSGRSAPVAGSGTRRRSGPGRHGLH